MKVNLHNNKIASERSLARTSLNTERTFFLVFDLIVLEAYTIYFYIELGMIISKRKFIDISFAWNAEMCINCIYVVQPERKQRVKEILIVCNTPNLCRQFYVPVDDIGLCYQAFKQVLSSPSLNTFTIFIQLMWHFYGNTI